MKKFNLYFGLTTIVIFLISIHCQNSSDKTDVETSEIDTSEQNADKEEQESASDAENNENEAIKSFYVNLDKAQTTEIPVGNLPPKKIMETKDGKKVIVHQLTEAFGEGEEGIDVIHVLDNDSNLRAEIFYLENTFGDSFSIYTEVVLVDDTLIYLHEQADKIENFHYDDEGNPAGNNITEVSHYFYQIGNNGQVSKIDETAELIHRVSRSIYK